MLSNAKVRQLRISAGSKKIIVSSSNNIYYIQIHHFMQQTMLIQWLYYTIQYLEPNTKSWWGGNQWRSQSLEVGGRVNLREAHPWFRSRGTCTYYPCGGNCKRRRREAAIAEGKKPLTTRGDRKSVV